MPLQSTSETPFNRNRLSTKSRRLPRWETWSLPLTRPPETSASVAFRRQLPIARRRRLLPLRGAICGDCRTFLVRCRVSIGSLALSVHTAGNAFARLTAGDR